uniref:Uncharacterized protein n=1 Tax=Entomoneis paludosa TaxID=265537 RepID=A0A7S2YPV3_9STRA|mmetsp:Transcript_4541/g.9696  ORF Transcript_4541/g.9696 Transcript_4541/m.9696 type:complete len:250 (+) Transcript_4541:380-1129(+)
MFERYRTNMLLHINSFEPIVGGDLVQSAISGSVGTNLDVMLPKSKMFFNAGWVLDLSQSEKKAKQKLGLFGGLGFLDSKKAFYGIVMSGQLEFLLPYERDSNRSAHLGGKAYPKVGDAAAIWYRSVVVCEVNEKLDVDSCDMGRDLGFEIGGVNATESATVINAAGTLYLGRKLCVHIPVPVDSVLTTPALIKERSNATLSKTVVFPNKDEEWENQIGLQVGIRVRNPKIVQRTQACSVSHIVWQQQTD